MKSKRIYNLAFTGRGIKPKWKISQRQIEINSHIRGVINTITIWFLPSQFGELMYSILDLWNSEENLDEKTLAVYENLIAITDRETLFNNKFFSQRMHQYLEFIENSCDDSILATFGLYLKLKRALLEESDQSEEFMEAYYKSLIRTWSTPMPRCLFFSRKGMIEIGLELLCLRDIYRTIEESGIKYERIFMRWFFRRQSDLRKFANYWASRFLSKAPLVFDDENTEYYEEFKEEVIL
jgi:hypothetical protein